MVKRIKRKLNKYFSKIVAAMVFVVLIFFSLCIGISGVVTMGIFCVDSLIKEEQIRDLNKFEEKIIIANKHIGEVQVQVAMLVNTQIKELSSEQKDKLLKSSWTLRKDSLRIENALLNHQNDWSVNLYPRKNEEIEEKFRDYWRAHILIDRVVSDIERFSYTEKIDKFQLEKLQENLQGVQEFTEIK